MDWQSEDRDAWVGDAERWISQIKGVLQCKIDLAPDGEVSGVHVVARSDREPRHIVRDVEGLLKARLGISVFYKKIGVVQVVEAEVPTVRYSAAVSPDDKDEAEAQQDQDPERAQDKKAGATKPAAAGRSDQDRDPAVRDAVLLAEELAPRLLCNGVGVMMNGTVLRAEVDLQAAGLEASGVAEGSNRNGGDLHLVAAATLDAIENLIGEPLGLELSELRRERLGGIEVILIAVTLVRSRCCEQLYGVCHASANLHQAVVYAVLDALNRRLEMMLFQQADDGPV